MQEGDDNVDGQQLGADVAEDPPHVLEAEQISLGRQAQHHDGRLETRYQRDGGRQEAHGPPANQVLCGRQEPRNGLKKIKVNRKLDKLKIVSLYNGVYGCIRNEFMNLFMNGDFFFLSFYFMLVSKKKIIF